MKPKIVKIFILLFGIYTLHGCVMIHEPENIVLPETVYPASSENSLWPGENLKNMLFIDNKARFKEDIITVLVEEQSLAEKEATTETKRESDMTMGLSSLFGLQQKNTRPLSAGSLAGAVDNDFKGEGKTKRSGKFQAIITAKIVDIMDNGNFYIEGKRKVKVNSEAQYMTISGTVRPVDIGYDNSVLSRYISNAKIEYTGIGVIDDKQRPGWAIRLLDWVWPF